MALPVVVAPKEKDSGLPQVGDNVTVLDRIRGDWKVYLNKKIHFCPEETFDASKIPPMVICVVYCYSNPYRMMYFTWREIIL